MTHPRILRFDTPPASQITPRELALDRRRWLQGAALAGAGVAAASLARPASAAETPHRPALAAVPGKTPGSLTMDKPTARADATSYNNYYEFGTSKSAPALSADALPTQPWSVVIDGEVGKPLKLDIDALRKLAAMEERIYRLRCVEGWSMVIPWIGYPLAELIRRAEPNGNAKFVQFTTIADAAHMPGVRDAILDWPYTEGLRLDEAMHPLTLLAFGMYGEILPNQNGAPLRLVVPWKYGFKSAKALVRIRLVEKMPQSSWMRAAPQEYGFYANVNPKVDHPRWSQAGERRIGEDGLFARKRPTLMFNGYEPQVGQLYTGMDLARNY